MGSLHTYQHCNQGETELTLSQLIFLTSTFKGLSCMRQRMMPLPPEQVLADGVCAFATDF